MVQLYIRNTAASVEQPLRELKGFTRIALAPGRDKARDLSARLRRIEFLQRCAEEGVEPTTYDIWVGGSSLATAETTVKIVE